MTGEDEAPIGGHADGESGRAVADGSGDEGTAVRRDRFSGGPAREFMSSLEADRRIFGADVAVDRAHVVMLAEQGIVPEDTAGEILAALDEIEAAVEERGYDATLPGGEDVHEAIETAVIDRVGAEGGRMHTARSRNDEVATCIRYRLREDVLDLVETVDDVREALLAAAREHAETLMPGFTHLQPAQPITVGHWLASYESALARDAERLLDAYDRVNRNPLGAGAFAGTTFDVDRERTAELLGFTDPETDDPVLVENSIDAAAGRDVLVEVAGALSALAVTCSGLAEDVVLFANRGWVDLDDDYASTSSIMPQKKNPDSLELVRAVAGDAVSAFQGVATTLKGLPRAYNRDLQRAGPHVWEGIDVVSEAVAVAGGAVATAEWEEAALADAAGEGFSTATGVADLLAKAGVPFRQAHEVVALAAEEIAAESAGGERSDGSRSSSDRRSDGAPDPETAAATLDAAANEVLGDDLDAYVSDEALADALDPAESVASRDSAGGPAPEAVAAAVERAEADLADARAAAGERREALDRADERLRAEVSAYV